MELSTEQASWIVKVLQPERTVASLPGGWAGLAEETRAALLGLSVEVYATQHARLVSGWAVILSELLATRRPDDGISVVISAVSGETTTHALIRIGNVIALQPDWVLFFIGMNDARTQGANATKTLVDHHETARNLAELQRRAARETKARCLWITPSPVMPDRIEKHWGLSRFGVGFRNEDLARVAEAIRQLDAPHVDLVAALNETPPANLLTEDGLHLLLEGQKRIALEVVRGWSELSG